MNIAENQPQAEIQKDGSDKEKSNDGIGMGVVPTISRSILSKFSSVELWTLRDGNENLGLQDQEKGTPSPSGKYAKYAGDAPDGGYKAWSVILGTMATSCATFGLVTTWGVFQAYYEEVMLPNGSSSDIAWIGSVQYALALFPGLITGRPFDTGYFRIPYFFASCLMIVCIFASAECKVYWQFFLAQGLGVGLASGILFGPALGIVSHWFTKRRGLALGLTGIGSSIGATAFPIAAQNLMPEVGFKWTLRIFGLMSIVLLGIGNLTMDRRLPPMDVKGGLFNWAALKNPAYAAYCISGATTFLGLYTVLTYIPITAVQVGVSNDFAFYLIAIANGASGFGRISAGILADKIGPLNVIVPLTTVAAIMTFIWPFASSEGALIAIAVIYGFSCGAYVSLLSLPIMSMGAINDVGRRTGLFLSFTSFGALAGTPISGAINSSTGGFENVGWYGGSVLLLSVCLMLLTRYLHLGKMMGKC